MIDKTDQTQRITLHYALRLDDGTVVDSTADDEPLSLVIGDGMLHPALERCLTELSAGAGETFRISSEEGFGPYDPEMIQPLDRAEFSDPEMLEPGTMIAFETPTGETLPGRVLSVDGQHVLVDFNHPLAGRDFEFEVRILSRG